jgi:hypothetical protein
MKYCCFFVVDLKKRGFKNVAEYNNNYGCDSCRRTCGKAFNEMRL